MRSNWSLSHIKRITDAVEHFLAKELKFKLCDLHGDKQEYSVTINFASTVDTEEWTTVEGSVLRLRGVAQVRRFKVEINATQTDDCIWIS